MHKNVDMWRYWQLEEGVLRVKPEVLLTNNGEMPPVLHVDTEAPLKSDVDGSIITDEMWGSIISQIGISRAYRVEHHLTKFLRL